MVINIGISKRFCSYPSCRHHFFRVENSVLASRTSVLAGDLDLLVGGLRVEVYLGPGLLKLSRCGRHEGGDTSGSTKSISVRTEVLGVAKFTKYFTVWRIATADGVERLLTFKADETFLYIKQYVNKCSIFNEEETIHEYSDELTL